MDSELIDKIFTVKRDDFVEVALEVFRFQYENNPVYRQFVDVMPVRPEDVKTLTAIPFLPIRFFKSHQVQTTVFSPEAVFESSGTMQTGHSRHYVKDVSVYRKSFITAFESVYGKISEWCIVGLLPSYLERKNSSLVLMVDEMIRMSNHAGSGFYLHDFDSLNLLLQALEGQKQKTIFIGVSFALLDFAERFSIDLQHVVVMETGGMKGRREELTREEVHAILKKNFGIQTVHSEYGMTELLSQAYSSGDGKFFCPPWMKMLVREEDDPMALYSHAMLKHARPSLSGLLNVIDLANIYSCSFIATDDVAKLCPDGSVEILGRMDNSDIRGCSLMVV